MTAARLESDREQIGAFVDALFRYADADAFVSLRSFGDGADADTAKAKWMGVKLNGAGLDPLINAATREADISANAEDRRVFAPPVATFDNPDRATFDSLANGLALSVECDAHPAQARTTLERLLGPATCVVESGGVWTNGGGEAEPKLHLHWRLNEPTRTADEHTKLRRARALACDLVGGDATNKAIVHPIRWPGSWHRKGEPTLCRFAALNADREIGLDDAIERLEGAVSALPPRERARTEETADTGGEARSDGELISAILTGAEYHRPLAALAMRYIWRGMSAENVRTTLAGIMETTPAQERDERWHARIADIPRAVESAVRKYDAEKNARSSDWPEPDSRLLNKGARPAPALPLDCFRSLGPWIMEMGASKSAPPDYVALSLLVTAAGTVGASRSIRLRDGFVQPSILWGELVGGPSSSKSPSFAPFKAAASAIERDEQGDAAQKRREHETRRQEAKERRAQWEASAKSAVKEGKGVSLMTEAEEDPGEWVPPRLVVGNSTPEALTHLFAGNPRGLLLHRDELSGLFGDFGKYGGDGDAAFYLSAYDGDFTPTDRVKAGALRAERAQLSILGGIQPERLQEQLLARTNDGLVSRFLPVWPDTVNALWSVPLADEARVERLLRRLRGLAMATAAEGRFVPRVLSLSLDADQLMGAWFEEQHARARSETGFVAEFLGKSYGVVGRLALVLELLEWAAGGNGSTEGPQFVSLDSVACALRLHADYFEPMARRTFGDAAISNEERCAIALLAELRKRRALRFNAREARRSWGVTGLSGRTADLMKVVLAVLEDGDCVRREDSEAKGRKPENYLVNPRVHEAAL